jgi:hypothetical protein
MASRRKRGPVAFRPRLSAGLALSSLPSLNTSIARQKSLRKTKVFLKIDVTIA